MVDRGVKQTNINELAPLKKEDTSHQQHVHLGDYIGMKLHFMSYSK